MDALVELINDIKEAQAKSAPAADLNLARDFQRKAQFLLDYVEAENSMEFHASGEALRILTDSVNFTRQGQLAVRGVNRNLRLGRVFEFRAANAVRCRGRNL
jgi:nitrite reductase (cytochrome c-552)